MKQLDVTGRVKERLQAAVGPDVDVSKHLVFEATALNNRPVRQNHPIYKGAVHTSGYMQAVADSINSESAPLQVMHQRGELPYGRVFHADVVNDGPTTKLQAQFFIDPSQSKFADAINTGTIDQVSIGALPKSAVCNLCGFDFLGEDAPWSTLYSGTCPDGHKMGNDAHAIVGRLDTFHELSLVNKGGITGARIASPSQSQLMADGPEGLRKLFDQAKALTLSSNELDLSVPVETPQIMDKDTLAAFTAAIGKNAVLESENIGLKAKVTDLEAKVAAAGSSATLQADLDAAKTETQAANAALQTVAGKLLTLAGQADPALPTEPTKIVELVEAKAADLAAALAKGAGKTEPATKVDDVRQASLSAAHFISPRR